MQNRHAALRIVDSVTDRPESQIANRTRALCTRSTAQNGGIKNRRRLISVCALVIVSYKNVPCGATPRADAPSDRRCSPTPVPRAAGGHCGAPRSLAQIAPQSRGSHRAFAAPLVMHLPEHSIFPYCACPPPSFPAIRFRLPPWRMTASGGHCVALSAHGWSLR